MAEEKAEGIFVCRAGNSNPFCGIWVQSISTLGFCTTPPILQCYQGVGRRGKREKNGERNTATRAGILILNGCEI